MKKKCLALVLALAMLSCACGNTAAEEPQTTETQTSEAAQTESTAQLPEARVIDDKYRNYYEIFPYSFRDSNGDGIGDINGITESLDYIEDLGINGIWLTPVCASPTYHKYDVTDYYAIDSQFGTMEDFEQFLSECHARGIRVIMDLVVNHTSSEHPWFQAASDYMASLGEGEEPSAEDCPYYEYYNFSRESSDGWEQVSGSEWYYECRFWGGMPDLNLDSEAVRGEIEQIASFWLEKGVDGFRLDATTSYYTNHTDQNIEFLTWLNACVKEKNPDAYIVGECWENIATYSQYYASGVDSFFDFDFADKNGKIAKLLKGGSAISFGNAIVSTQEAITEYNADAVDAAFTSNHDMGRSAGYYPGEIGEAETKMAQALAMLMGGSYFLYYGDELGMKGSGADENFRAPMQWSSDASAEGMCDSIATDAIDMKFGSLETQESDESSIYNYVRRALAYRNAYPQIARGTTTVNEDLSDDNILVMIKEWEGEELLIVVNPTENAFDVDLSGVSLNGKTSGDLQEAGVLLAGDGEVTVSGSSVSMGAFSVAFFE
jgi:glycosidase